MKNVCRFNGFNSRSLATLFIILSCGFWILGASFSPAIAVDRITGDQAVENLKSLLGTPEDFQSDMKATTQDFIADHFGSMAIAAAFGIAIRMRS